MPDTVLHQHFSQQDICGHTVLNNNGQLGNLDVDNSSVPVLVGKGEINVTPSELTIRKGDTVEINPLLTISATDAFNLLGPNRYGLNKCNIHIIE